MSDTLSSEIGGLFDRPRLITSFEPVDPGTDGAVSWQGELAGVVGAGRIGLAACRILLGFGGVAEYGRFNRPGDHRLARRIGGELVEQRVLRATADDVNHVNRPTGNRADVVHDGTIFQREAF